MKLIGGGAEPMGFPARDQATRGGRSVGGRYLGETAFHSPDDAGVSESIEFDRKIAARRESSVSP